MSQLDSTIIHNMLSDAIDRLHRMAEAIYHDPELTEKQRYQLSHANVACIHIAQYAIFDLQQGNTSLLPSIADDIRLINETTLLTRKAVAHDG